MMTVVLVSVILVITVRLLHRAAAAGTTSDTDSTYYPASDSVDTLYTPTDHELPPVNPPLEYADDANVHHPEHSLYNNAPTSPVQMQYQHQNHLSIPIYGTVGRKIKPPTPTIQPDNYLVHHINLGNY